MLWIYCTRVLVFLIYINAVIHSFIDTEEESIHTASEKTKFNLQEVIIKALQSKDAKELPLKRLQKKVLAEFEATGGGNAADVKMIAKFNKKLYKIPGVVVRKEVVKLLC
jgi:hypothetical protein